MSGPSCEERTQHKATLFSGSPARTGPSDVSSTHVGRPPLQQRRSLSAELLLQNQILALQTRLSSIRRNFSLLLVYATICLDFLGITLLSPGMRFLVSPNHDDAFYDFRNASCAHSSGGCAAAADAMAPGTAISVMMFTFGLGQLISTPLMGWASDRFGKRNILLISTAGTAASFVLQGLVWRFWPHAAARFVGGLFSGSRPVCQSYIASSVPKAQRPRMMGYVALAVMLAMQFGPVVRRAILELDPWNLCLRLISGMLTRSLLLTRSPPLARRNSSAALSPRCTCACRSSSPSRWRPSLLRCSSNTSTSPQQTTAPLTTAPLMAVKAVVLRCAPRCL